MPADRCVRRYTIGDETAINRGFNEVFSRARSLAEWSWKFPLADGGRAILLAERGGEVEAHFAGIPLRYRIDGRQVEVFSVVDVYARPSALRGVARRGLMLETAEAFFDHYGAAGRHPFVLGFPSPRHRRLGVLQFGYVVVPPQPLTALWRSAGRRQVGPRRLLYRAEPARDWEPRLDDLWRRVRASYPVAMVRDAEYALRRLAGHPAVHYHRFLILPRLSGEPVAFVAFRTDDRRCRWVDLVWDHDHPGALELGSVLSARLGAQVGASCEEMWLEGDDEGASVLLASGFEARPEPQDLALVVRRLDSGFDADLLADRAYVTMADADLV